MRSRQRKMMASMGPGFVHPGNRIEGCRDAFSSLRFNGARVCTPGKSPPRSRRPRCKSTASMGPGFVHPGNRDSLRSRGQRSEASMGPGFVHPGNPASGTARRYEGDASMGPGFVHPGNCRSGRLSRQVHLASMGPGFVHPGNSCIYRGRAPDRTLQWGPGLYTREISSSRAGSLPASFASMGPGFVHPGNVPGLVRLAITLTASMGPGFVHPGNSRAGRPVSMRVCRRNCEGSTIRRAIPRARPARDHLKVVNVQGKTRCERSLGVVVGPRRSHAAILLRGCAHRKHRVRGNDCRLASPHVHIRDVCTHCAISRIHQKAALRQPKPAWDQDQAVLQRST